MKTSSMRIFLFFCWFACFSLSYADGLNYNVVNLSVTSEREVDNDTMTVMLQAEEQSSNPATVNESINKAMQWALKQLKSPALQTNTGQYEVYPLYKDERITGWRGQQTLTLSSTDINLLTKLTGQLQEKLQVKSMHFSVSKQRRDAVQNELVAEVIAALNQRIDVIKKALSANDHEMIRLNIETQNRSSMRQSRQVARYESMMADAAPAVEGGQSVVKVSADASIQLKIP